MARVAFVGTCIVFLAGIAFAIISWKAPTLLETAELSLAGGDEQAAIREFRLHLARNPEDKDVRMKLAALTAPFDPAESLEHLRFISSEDAQYIEALRQVAIICLKTERHAEAEESLLKLEASVPDDFAVQLSLAEFYFHQEDYKAALPRAMHAATLNPDRAETWLLIAEIRDELRQKPEMIAPLQKAIHLAPDLYEAHLNLAYACYACGQLVEAAKQARWCLNQNPEEVFAVRILASIARDEGRFDEAWVTVRKAMKLAPRDIDCRILEADLLLYDRKPDEAYRRLKELYDEHQETYRYLGSLARAAAASGHTDEAQHLHVELDELRSTENKMKPQLSLSRPPKE